MSENLSLFEFSLYICAIKWPDKQMKHKNVYAFELFQPPQTPTSKNYAEMRDRLRLRLKKKVGSQVRYFSVIFLNQTCIISLNIHVY